VNKATAARCGFWRRAVSTLTESLDFGERKPDVPKLLIFDPPQSCATGACSPDDEDASEKFEAFLVALREEGIEASRFNLGYHPKAFAENEIVKDALLREGVGALPLAIVDGVVLTRGGYPTREALERALGRIPPAAAPPGKEAD
jgi:hypothetical protein